MNSSQTPFLLVVSAPSGTGKSTLIRRYMTENPGHFSFSLSTTTRLPRTGEQNGIDYRFITKTQFQSEIHDQKFAEWAEFNGNFYGTLKHNIELAFSEGRCLIKDIELQGYRQLKKAFPAQVKGFFLAPPSLVELEKRLRTRGTDSEQEIASRLKIAKIELAAQDEYDRTIINDDLETSYRAFAHSIQLWRIEFGQT